MRSLDLHGLMDLNILLVHFEGAFFDFRYLFHQFDVFTDELGLDHVDFGLLFAREGPHAIINELDGLMHDNLDCSLDASVYFVLYFHVKLHKIVLQAIAEIAKLLFFSRVRLHFFIEHEAALEVTGVKSVAQKVNIVVLLVQMQARE